MGEKGGRESYVKEGERESDVDQSRKEKWDRKGKSDVKKIEQESVVKQSRKERWGKW